MNPPRKACWNYHHKMLCWHKISCYLSNLRSKQKHLASCQLNCLLVNLPILLFCRLQVVPFIVRLMNQVIVFPLKNTLRKFITWEINRDKDTIKEDFQDSSKVPTISKGNGDHTLEINSIRIRVDHPIGHFNKDQIFSREPPN